MENIMLWINLERILFIIILPILLLIVKHWLKSTIENSIKNNFNKEIEGLKSDFRKSEEKFKGEIRLKEREISALREMILTGRVNRQALADKRRMQAAEKLWSSIIQLKPYMPLVKIISTFNIDYDAKRISSEPKLQQFLEVLLHDPLMVYAIAEILQAGDYPLNFLSDEKVSNLLKTALPHHSDYIDNYKFSGYYHLLLELESMLENKIKKIFDGEEMDKANIAFAKNIRKKADEVEEELERMESTLNSFSTVSDNVSYQTQLTLFHLLALSYYLVNTFTPKLYTSYSFITLSSDFIKIKS